MIEGLWILTVQPPPAASGGVIVFIRDKVFGGDSGFTWMGHYSLSGQILKGRVRVHNFDPLIKSVLGVEGDYEMHFSGFLSGDVITGTAIIANQPKHSLALHMKRYAPL